MGTKQENAGTHGSQKRQYAESAVLVIDRVRRDEKESTKREMERVWATVA
jgi:hypothetical protein